jgi:hypothetical protein
LIDLVEEGEERCRQLAIGRIHAGSRLAQRLGVRMAAFESPGVFRAQEE